MSRPVLSVLVCSQTALWILTNYKNNSHNCNQRMPAWYSDQDMSRNTSEFFFLSIEELQVMMNVDGGLKTNSWRVSWWGINTMVGLHCKQWGSFLQSHAQTFWWWWSPSPSHYLSQLLTQHRSPYNFIITSQTRDEKIFWSILVPKNAWLSRGRFGDFLWWWFGRYVRDEDSFKTGYSNDW